MNYQLEMEKQLQELIGVPKLLLHSCCAPCSSYVLSYLTNYFDITILYYNPNIFPEEEFEKRYVELEKFIQEFPFKNKITLKRGNYQYEEYEKQIDGYQQEREGGKRCYLCYYLRMEESMRYAKEHNFDYMTTTLSISPHKNAIWINEIGKELEEKYGVSYLYSDFKKKDGYKTSITLSKKYGLYRQDYCGCVYSRKERKNDKN